MRFSAVAIAFAAVAPSAFGFTTSNTAFVAKSVSSHVGKKNSGVSQLTHGRNCACSNCASHTQLFMSTEVSEDVPAEVSEDVPAEVASMDGVDSEEEAHNAERPARGSGIHKHKKGKSGGIALSEVEVGSTLEGTVKGITSYGAFLDIGTQTDALLHVSRMSDDFVANVEDVVKKGDVVSVRVVSVDLEKSQVAVTMRSEEAESRSNNRGSGGGKRKDRPRRSGGDRQAQMATLTSLANEGFDADKFVEGEVVSMLDFGAFVRVDASQLGENITGELDGLVHISSLAIGRVEKVASVVSVGEKVQVRVKAVDAEGGKVSLSMIAAEDEQAPRQNRPKRRGRAMFSEDEMGAKDWKESMDTINEEQPTFSNMPIIVDKRN